MRNLLRILVLSSIHCILTLVCLVGEFQTASFLFEKPGPSHPFWSVMLKIFEFPFLTLVHVFDPQKMTYYLPVMILNSLLWGFVLNGLILLVRKRRQGRAAAITSQSF